VKTITPEELFDILGKLDKEQIQKLCQYRHTNEDLVALVAWANCATEEEKEYFKRYTEVVGPWPKCAKFAGIAALYATLHRENLYHDNYARLMLPVMIVSAREW
jgi:hypothetical protein